MKMFTTCAALCLALAVIGCGKSAEQKRMEDAAKQAGQAGQALKEGAQQMADAMKQFGQESEGESAVQPVDFRELKGLLPASLPGLTRSGAEGEKTSVMGIKVSEAHASYDNDAGASVRIKITDMGSVSGFVGLATLAWTHAEIDRETDSGYERTTTYNGHKAYEKYDTETQGGEIQVFVEGRFVVEVEGSNVTMDVLKAAAGTIDMAKLASMKTATPAS